MSEQTRRGWGLPVFAAVATAAAGGFAFLYWTRPNAGELGAIRVVVADDDGKTGNQVTIHVAEAPLIQKEPVSPGNSFNGVVRFPHPYRNPPHLRIVSSGKRIYDVIEVNEFLFSWVARPLPDDFREETRKTPSQVDSFLGLGLTVAAASNALKPNLIFEDFSWEAKGVRMPATAWPAKPPKTFEQKGSFYTIAGQEGPISFPVPYATIPKVELTSGYRYSTIITEVTATGFKWKNVMKERQGNEGDVSWASSGLIKEGP